MWTKYYPVFVYSPAETERLLGVSHTTCYRLIAAGKLDARKLGGKAVSIRRGPWAEGSWADQPVVAGGLLSASRSLAALCWLAIRLRASLIGRSSMRLGIVIVERFLGFGMARVCGAGGSVEGL
ncbi:MAG: helix-turn-helix domain-containing protein, partial [Stellaceae bacterium]